MSLEVNLVSLEANQVCHCTGRQLKFGGSVEGSKGWLLVLRNFGSLKTLVPQRRHIVVFFIMGQCLGISNVSKNRYYEVIKLVNLHNNRHPG